MDKDNLESRLASVKHNTTREKRMDNWNFKDVYNYRLAEYLQEDNDDFEMFLTTYLRIVQSDTLKQIASQTDRTPHQTLIDILLDDIDERRMEWEQARLGV